MEKNILNKPKQQWMESDGKRFNVTEFSYTPDGAIDTVRTDTDLGPAITAYRYDSFGNVTQITDPLCNVTQHTYLNGILPVQTVVKDLNWTTL